MCVLCLTEDGTLHGLFLWSNHLESLWCTSLLLQKVDLYHAVSLKKFVHMKW